MKKILLPLFILFFNCAVYAETVQDLNPELVNKLHELNQTKQAQTEVIKNTDMSKRVTDFGNKDMPDLLNRVQEYNSKLSSDFGYEDDSEKTCYEKRELGEISLYVFISSSIPEETLKTYAADLKKLPGAVMVLNGVIGGASKIMPTVDLISRISCGKNVSELKTENSDCTMARTDINPYLFRVFGIDKVPAFVMADLPYSQIMMSASQGQNIPDNSFLKISGDPTLEYVLKHFNSSGNKDAADLLIRLRSGYYD